MERACGCARQDLPRAGRAGRGRVAGARAAAALAPEHGGRARPRARAPARLAPARVPGRAQARAPGAPAPPPAARRVRAAPAAGAAAALRARAAPALPRRWLEPLGELPQSVRRACGVCSPAAGCAAPGRWRGCRRAQAGRVWHGERARAHAAALTLAGAARAQRGVAGRQRGAQLPARQRGHGPAGGHAAVQPGAARHARAGPGARLVQGGALPARARLLWRLPWRAGVQRGACSAARRPCKHSLGLVAELQHRVGLQVPVRSA